MVTVSPRLHFFLTLSKAQSIASRRFDARLNGLGWNDFMILLYLSESRDEKMRRIDLAEKVGLTASGITRLLAPMEKIGLIKREAHPHDARVSVVTLAPGGKRKLSEAMEDAEMLAEEMTATITAKKMKDAKETIAMMHL